jgi:hypothetical protein
VKIGSTKKGTMLQSICSETVPHIHIKLSGGSCRNFSASSLLLLLLIVILHSYLLFGKSISTVHPSSHSLSDSGFSYYFDSIMDIVGVHVPKRHSICATGADDTDFWTFLAKKK